MTRPTQDFADWRVTVMGLGRHGGGVAAVRYLARHGARVTVTDLADETVLGQSLQQLADLSLAGVHCGEHREADFVEADLVVVNPAVRRDAPMLRLAQASGVEVTSEIELFLEACPATVIGVTGSNGKSTTSSMLAAMLQADGRRCHLGGNIGHSLLGELDHIAATDWVVLELSSFQLAHLSPQARMPAIAVVTNCAPNHLDWHPDYEDYRTAKQRLTGQPRSDGFVVLGDDPEVAQWSSLCGGKRIPLVPADMIPPLPVPGGHNIANARCAATAALGIGCREASIETALRSFLGLSHRLELVTEYRGRRFYEDSSATTPESSIAAIGALDRPVWLLAGGKDKGTDFAQLGQCVARNARGACFYGQARGQLLAAVNQHNDAQRADAQRADAQRADAQRADAQRADDCEVHQTQSLHDALRWCWQRSQPGEAILLSPACASYDQFRDYEHRAAMFRQWVGELTADELNATVDVERTSMAFQRD